MLRAHDDAARGALPAYLAEQGYGVLPVNPAFVGRTIADHRRLGIARPDVSG